MASKPAPKILAIGSPNSSLKKLVTKITAFQTNYGPFECCVIVGNLFKKNEDGSSLTSDLEFPIPTYFTHPTHPLSPSLSAKLNSGSTSGSPEILPNLIYLGKTGVFKTSSGVGVGFIGGAFTDDNEEGEEGTESAKSTLSKEDLNSLLAHPNFLAHTLPSTPGSNNPGSSSNSIQVNYNININPTTSGNSNANQGPTLSLAQARAQAQKEQKAKELDAVPSWARGLDVLILGAGTERLLKALPASSIPPSTTGTGAGAVEATETDSTTTPPTSTTLINPPEVDPIISRSRARYILLPSQADNKTSGYAEGAPFGWTGPAAGGRAGQGQGGKEERWTRVVRVDRFAEDEVAGGGAVKGEKGEKKKFFYAFTLPDLTSAPPARPEVVGANPFNDPRGMKRGHNGEDGEGDGKRMRGEYVCKICNQPGHHIRDCPEKGSKPRPPPPEYTCHRCNQSGHWIQDCPELPAGGAGPKKEIKMLTMDECWFCLANTNCDTRFIAAVQNDTYVALSKGQMIKTGDSKNPPLVPGGAHLLIIPIQHIPNPLLLPEDEARPLLAEINQIKDQVRKTFAKYDAVPVFCDMYRNLARAQHGQIQAVPVPKSRASELEGMFRKAAKREGWEFEEGDAESLLRRGKGREFIKLDLPDGQSLVHFIQGKFNLQFARQHLADFLGTPERANWQVCQTTDEQVKRDVNAFKKAFTS